MYINCKTYFSFHYGTLSTEELVKAGVEAGATALALTNINATCDAWDFLKYCQERQIKPILGVEIRNGHQLLYILLAKNNRGFRWINEFLSEFLMAKKEFPAVPVLGAASAFAAEPADASSLADVFVIYPLGSKEPAALLANEYIGVQPTEVNKLLRIPVASYPGKFVVRQPVTFQNKTYYNLHRLLRAVDKNTLLSKLPDEEQADEQEYFWPQVRILETFQQVPELIINTHKLMDACAVTMKFGEDKNKKVFGASREDDRILLEKLAREGLVQRYGGDNKAAAERMIRELRIIDEMGFSAYFLITLDMIRYARSRGFYHVGRGSGANSLVAYCLQITDVDPIELDLYFERFLNPQRTSPPDFDIDFSYRDRDEVIDYMFK
ncbi:MAG: PHP domain-containing protein, partial [Bacteroidota bacterium]